MVFRNVTGSLFFIILVLLGVFSFSSAFSTDTNQPLNPVESSYLIANKLHFFLLLSACLSILLSALLIFILYREKQRRIRTEELLLETKEKFSEVEKLLSETEKKLYQQQKFSDTLAHATPDLLYVYDFVE